MHKSISAPIYLALWVFALAMGLIEAAVVIYLRRLMGKDLFPVREALSALGPHLGRLEAFREMATLVVLLLPSLVLERGVSMRVAVYLLVFGIWDLAYYAFLQWWIGWPGSLLAYDILFLIPSPWVAPVIGPIAVASALVAASTLYLFYARNRMPRLPNLLQSVALVAGAAGIIASFLWDTGYYQQGGMPPRFAWAIFGAGFAVALAALVHFLAQFAAQDKARFF